MDRLAGATELLDGPLDDEAALAGNLRDLRRINRFLGGVAISLRAIARFPSQDAGPLRILDVGTGGADIPVAIRRRWRRTPRPMITAVDSRPEVLRAARAAQPSLDKETGIELAVSDGRTLPFPDGAFDVAHSSLVLHHLEPADAVEFLRELARVARSGVVVNDLDRARVHWLGAWLIGHLFTRNRMTRYDAPLSVRRAYRPAEVRGLLEQAGLRPIAIDRAFMGHRYAIAAVGLEARDRETPADASAGQPS